MNTWENWSNCSTTCGPGTKTRSRDIAINAAYGGANCTGPTDDETDCNLRECPGKSSYFLCVDCSLILHVES